MKSHRNHRSRQAWMIVSLAIVAGCLYFWAQHPPREPVAVAEAPAAAPAPERATSGAMAVYFAPDTPGATDGIAAALAACIVSAKVSVYCAFYELDYLPAARALMDRKAAGVSVGIVSDSDYKGEPAIRDCIAAGIPVVFDERNPFMHDKFCVVDGEKVWTGSTNVTENCLFRNNNNAICIESPELARDYTAEFREMFELRLFGAKSPRTTPYPEVTVGTARIECYFAPEDQVQSVIVQKIRAAAKTIDFMAFSFTSDEIAEAMAARMAAGVRVRGLFEKRNAGSSYSRDEWLAGQGAEVRLDRNEYSMHHKVIVLDRETTVLGSYNFSNSAETKNDENVLIVRDRNLAAAYEAEFARLW